MGKDKGRTKKQKPFLDLDLDILSLRKTLHNKESYRKAIIVVNDKTCKIHSKRTQKNLKIREK